MAIHTLLPEGTKNSPHISSSSLPFRGFMGSPTNSKPAVSLVVACFSLGNAAELPAARLGFRFSLQSADRIREAISPGCVVVLIARNPCERQSEATMLDNA
jgi:hypothetical protein